MADLQLSDVGQLRDTSAINRYRALTERRGVAPEEALREVLATTRDRCRSPMQWGEGPNAGFTAPEAAPWLPPHPNHRAGVSVAAQAEDPGSLLSYYRRLLALRRAAPALVAGDFEALHPDSEAYLAFLRHDRDSGQTCLVVLNFSGAAQRPAFELGGRSARLRFSSAERPPGRLDLQPLSLAPFEVVILDLT